MQKQIKLAISIVASIAINGCQITQFTPTIAPKAINLEHNLSKQDGVRSFNLQRIYSKEINLGLSLQNFVSTVDLSKVSLEKLQAIPGDEVKLIGIPSKIGKIRIKLIQRDNGLVSWASLRTDSDGSVLMVVPIPYGDYRLANCYDVQVVVRGNYSPLLSLDVLPMPSASGHSTKILQRYTSIFEHISRLFPELSEETQFLLDGVDNPNSLNKTFAGNALVYENGALDKELADRLLATTNILSILDEYLAQLSSTQINTFSIQGLDKHTTQNLETPLTDTSMLQMMRDQHKFSMISSNAVFKLMNEVQKASSQLDNERSKNDPLIQYSTEMIKLEWLIISQLLPIMQATILPESFLPSKITKLDYTISAERLYSIGQTGTWGNAKLYAKSAGLKLNLLDLCTIFGIPSAKNVALTIADVAKKALIGYFAAEADPSVLLINPKTYVANVSEWCSANTVSTFVPDMDPRIEFIDFQRSTYRAVRYGQDGIWVTYDYRRLDNYGVHPSQWTWNSIQTRKYILVGNLSGVTELGPAPEKDGVITLKPYI